MMFHIGQKVVCVDGKPRPALNRYGCVVVVGAVYTIRGFEQRCGELGIYLEEVKSSMPPFPDGGERSFYADRFRPIVETKTDISIFTALLDPTKQRELAVTAAKGGGE